MSECSPEILYGKESRRREPFTRLEHSQRKLLAFNVLVRPILKRTVSRPGHENK